MNTKKFFTIFLISFSTLLLSACGGSDETETNTADNPGEKIYDAGDFVINYPQDWQVLEQQSFPSVVPTQTVLAFRNNIQNEIFTANLNISKKELDEIVGIEDFTKSTMAKIKTTLLSVQELPNKGREVPFGNGALNGIIVEFQGKKSSSEPLIHFKSLSVIKDQTAYTVTGAYLPTDEESVVNYIDKMLDSFSLK